MRSVLVNIGTYFMREAKAWHTLPNANLSHPLLHLYNREGTIVTFKDLIAEVGDYFDPVEEQHMLDEQGLLEYENQIFSMETVEE